MVPCESTADEALFERSHPRISSTDSKIRITLMSPLSDSGSEKVNGESNRNKSQPYCTVFY